MLTIPSDQLEKTSTKELTELRASCLAVGDYDTEEFITELICSRADAGDPTAKAWLGDSRPRPPGQGRGNR